MAAAELTETTTTLLRGLAPKIARIKQATQYDWVNFTCKGIWLINARLNTGAAATVTRPALTVKNTDTAYTATTTSIVYDGASQDRVTGSFYIETASGEIIEVTDSAPTAATGTLTVVKRGALGTTASATGIANDNTLYVMNAVILGDNQTGSVTLAYYEAEFDASNAIFS